MAGPFRKDRVSASALGCFVVCPEQYRQRYLLDRWDPTGPVGFVGSVAHDVIQAALTYKAGTGVLPPAREVVLMLDHAHHSRLASEDVDWQDQMTPGGARTRAGVIAAEYLERVAPALQLTGKPEAWFELAVSGAPVPVVGKLDLPVRVNTAELREPWRDRRDLLGEYEDVIVDLKTGGQAPKAVRPNWRLQGMIYAAVARVPVDYHTVTPYGAKGPVVRTPQSPTVTIPRATKKEPDPQPSVEYECGGLRVELDSDTHAGTLELLRRLQHAIAVYYEAFGPDEPWPSGAVTHQWACGYCSHKPACVYWHGTAPVLLDW